MLIQVLSAWQGNADGLNIATGNNEDDVIDLFALLDAPSDAYSWLCVRLWLAVRATLLRMKRRWRPCCEPALLPLEYLNFHLMGIRLGKI
jgi:hypothetical protein